MGLGREQFPGRESSMPEGNMKERVRSKEMALSRAHCAWRRMGGWTQGQN